MELRERTGNWFEIKVKYDKLGDEGTNKTTSETYVMDALNFSEAEEQIVDELHPFISGEFNIEDIKRAKYAEIFFSDADRDDKWYKVKVNMITFDEKTEKEKKHAVNYLAQADSVHTAVEYVEEVLGKGATDFQLATVQETLIMDVFERGNESKEGKEG